MLLKENIKGKNKIIKIVTDKKHKLSKHFLSWPHFKGVFGQGRKDEIPWSPDLSISWKERWEDALFRPRRNRRDELINAVKFSFNRTSHTDFAWPQFIIFFLLIIALLLPFQISSLYTKFSIEKAELIRDAQLGFNHWQAGFELALSGNIPDARDYFADAHRQFSEIKQGLYANHSLVAVIFDVSPVKPRQWTAAVNVLDSASLVSLASFKMTDFIASMQESGWYDTEEQLGLAVQKIQEVSRLMEEVNRLMSDVDTAVLPPGYKNTMEVFKESLPAVTREFSYLNRAVAATGKITGFTDGPKKILLVFQNNAELRASGGFMGSYGLIKIDKGKISILDMPGGGTYDFQGSVRKTLISPKPLHLINPVWQFQDVNWWPDWPTTAKKIAWFYEQGNGATVDSVVSFTPSFIERLLHIAGPLDMTGEYGVVIDKHNFYDIIQSFSERKLDETRESKKIIADIAPQLIERLYALNPEQSIDVALLLKESLEQGQFLIYLNDSHSEELLARAGLDGVIQDAPFDYLMAVHTNIAGGKSDRNIKDIIRLETTVTPRGNIKNTFFLTRTHHGREGVGFGGVRNVDYLRVYVPLGSTFVEASGFKRPPSDLFEEPPKGFLIDEDYSTIETNNRLGDDSGTEVFDSFGKTVFANWLMVDPGESTTITIEYLLPFTIDQLDKGYELYVQKQAGWTGGQFEYDVYWPSDLNIQTVGQGIITKQLHTAYSDIIDKDLHYIINIHNKKYATLEMRP